MPVAAANALGFALAWKITGAPVEYALGAATLLGCGLAIGDVHGSIISMLAPVNLQAFHSARKRRNIDQRGCLTEFLLHIATFLLLLTLLPLFVLLMPGLFYNSFWWALAGSAVCVTATWYYTRFVRREAERLLLQREPAIWRLLKEPF
jgi:Ca2+/Na+ antiporter